MGLRRGLSKTFQPSHRASPVLKGLFKHLRFGDSTLYRTSTQSFLCTDRESFLRTAQPSSLWVSRKSFFSSVEALPHWCFSGAFSDGWGGFAVGQIVWKAAAGVTTRRV